MVLRVSGFAGLIQLASDPQNAVGTQAHALGCACGAGGEGQLGGAVRHPVRATERAVPELAALLISSGLQFVLQWRFGNDVFGLALLQAMLALRRTEKRWQGYAGQTLEQRGQVPQHGLDTIVQCQGDHPDLFIAQALLTINDLGIERGVVELAMVVPQGKGVGFLLSMMTQGLFETLHFRRHGRPLQ
ncbi:hypothetical protein D3C80_919380 [compost metagenome]